MAKKSTSTSGKKPSLDIKDITYWANKKRFEWLDEQPDDLKKTFSPLIVMKWFSVSNGDSEYYIQAVNEFVNTSDFWTFSRNHPELIWKIFCAIGLPHNANTRNHGWVPMASSRKKIGKVDEIFLSIHPMINDEEISILKSKYSVESFKQLLLDMGLEDKEIKPILDEFKKANG